MRHMMMIVAVLASHGASACAPGLDFSFRPLLGTAPVHLCEQYAGKVVLVVNTASKCGYTPQYEGLEQLYRELAPKGLVVLGFPSNDFGGQEPGSEQQIKEFCRSTYGVQFPMFEKTSVSGPGANQFFQYLSQHTGNAPRWNFHKYLIDRNGKVVAAFDSKITPESQTLRDAIESLL